MVAVTRKVRKFFRLALSLGIARGVLVTSDAVRVPNVEIAILESESERLVQLSPRSC